MRTQWTGTCNSNDVRFLKFKIPQRIETTSYTGAHTIRYMILHISQSEC